MVDRPHRETLDQFQSDVLEATARGETLTDVCERICVRAQALIPDAICAVFAIENGSLRVLAAPSLPEDYRRALDHVPIGADLDTFEAAVFRIAEPRQVRDAPPAHAHAGGALAPGLHAGWFDPIRMREERVAGLFAFYYRGPREPVELERRVAAICTKLCAIAIEQAESRERIRRLAYFDTLTGLPNRTHFHEFVPERIAALEPGETLNLVCIDLDDFKSVNDALGSHSADLVLERVAWRIVACVGANDFVARLDGDKFAIAQVSDADETDSSLLAQKLFAMLDEPFDIDDQHVTINASIGIAQAASSETPLAELVRQVDLALRAAKDVGGNAYRFFEVPMEIAVQKRRDLRQALRAAIDNGDFKLHFQPIMVLESNQLGAAEALLRWQHAERGPIPPTVFIPIAEEMGLIGTLGDWALREACTMASGWPRPIKVGVNLSPLQFRKNGFTLDVVSALHQAGLPPQRLDLEITESALLARDVGTRTALHELHDFGVCLSLDDFGTGHSSLQLLRAFPFDRIKIDKSFVRDLDLDADSAAIIHAVIGLARDLGISTIAEGIESGMQRDWLWQHGCAEGQGYWFSPPLSAAAFQALLEQPGRTEELLRGSECVKA